MKYKNEIYMWLPEDLVRLELTTGRNKYISIWCGFYWTENFCNIDIIIANEQRTYYWSAWGWLGHKKYYWFYCKGINEKKQSQQIIVVTHNPNIVVNTNSEQVIHMEFAGGEINASHSGALQDFEIRDAICDVMEGGREALESRYYRITKVLE